MQIKTSSKNINYYILPSVIVIGQFAGISLTYSFFLLFSISIVLTYKIEKNKIENNNFLIQFITLTILFAFINISKKPPDLYSIMVWGQFLFIAIIPLIIKNNRILLNSFINIVFILFILDFIVNILMAIGINTPGIIIAETRPGEIFPRMQGIMNSNLYSSSISFIALCTTLDPKSFFTNKYHRFFFTIISILNILLAGANRTFIIALVVIFIFLFPSFRKNTKKNILLVISTILIVIVFTFYSAIINQSNSLRSQLWIITVEKISQKPFLGYGIYFPDASKVIASIESLSEMVVTESFLLSIAYSFGIISLLLFLLFIFKLLDRAKNNIFYTYQYGIFLGLSIELFFGGTLSNTLFTFIYFLSAYTIIEDNDQSKYYKIEK